MSRFVVVAASLIWSMCAPSLLCAATISIGANFKGTTLFNEFGMGTGFIPPDTMGAVGPNHVTEIINGAFAVYNKTGTLQTRITLNNFWNSAFTNAGTVATANNSFDPRILYDKASERWYAVSVDTRDSPDSRVLVGVTTGDDPSPANWRGFTIDADSAGTRWADFPTIGLDSTGLYISNNMFDVAGGVVETTRVTVIGVPKASLTAATPGIAGFVKQENIVANETGFSLQPAVDLDNTGLPLKALSAFNKSTGFLKTSEIPANFFTSSTLSTAGGFISVTARNGPPQAHQPGPDPDNIDAGDSRFSGNVVLQNGSLWGVHSVNIAGRSALEWYEIDAITNAILQNGTIADGSLDLYYPSIAVNEFDDVVIGFSGSGDTTPVSSYFTAGTTTSGITSLDPITLAFQGNGSYQLFFGGTRNRWGDYSATVIDPTNERSFWTFQEYVDEAAGSNNWAIRITEIQFDAVSVPEPSTFALAAVAALVMLARRSRGRCSAVRSGTSNVSER